MTSRTSRFVPAFIAGAVCVGAASALAAEPVQSEIDALRTRVAQLENNAQASQKAFDATIQSVLNDADGRTQLMADGGAWAGFDKGKVGFRDAAGNNSLYVEIQGQVRAVLNWVDVDSAEFDDGFEIRRAEFTFKGNVFSKNTYYHFEVLSEQGGGGLGIKSVYIENQIADMIWLGAGQFIDPESREQLTSSKRQLFPERSLNNNFIGLESQRFVQGVYGSYRSPQLAATVAFHDGNASDATTWQNGGQYFGISGRVDFAIMGNVAEGSKDFSANGAKEDTLIVGGGVSFTQSPGLNTYLYSIDAYWEMQMGLSVFGVFQGQLFDPFASGADSVHNFAFMVQAGYMIVPNEWEIIARLGFLFLDDDVYGDDDFFGEYGVGVNWYTAQQAHASKATAAIMIMPDGVPVSGSGLGYRTMVDETQVALILQYQFLIGTK